jgi:hypothetical protein
VIAVKLVCGTCPVTSRGAVAQLGERVVRNDEATGSIPVSSTNKSSRKTHFRSLVLGLNFRSVTSTCYFERH